MGVCNLNKDAIAKCCIGDSKAWYDFVNVYYGYIANIVGNTLSSRIQKNDNVNVEEVTQVVFEKMVKDDFKILKSWESDKSKFSTWLTVVTRRVAIDWLRKESKIHHTLQFESENIELYCIEENAQHMEHPEIRMDMLTERQQHIITLLYRDDMDVSDVAVALGVSCQTVRSVKHQALQRLRRHYGVAA